MNTKQIISILESVLTLDNDQMPAAKDLVKVILNSLSEPKKGEWIERKPGEGHPFSENIFVEWVNTAGSSFKAKSSTLQWDSYQSPVIKYRIIDNPYQS